MQNSSATPTSSPLSPSVSLLSNFRQELARFTPFSSMAVADLDFFITHTVQQYFAPGEKMVDPSSGAVTQLFFIRQGAVTGKRGLADLSGGAFQYEAGDMFPVSAAIARRPVTANYEAVSDTFALVLRCEDMDLLAQRSAPFADFLNRRVLHFLALSRQALQASYSSQALAEQSLETALGELARRAPVTCSPQTPLRQALTEMQQRHIGSILVTNAQGEPVGILSRYDILERVTLQSVGLDNPISSVMVQPVHCLSVAHTAEDAALLMSRRGIRHVPITDQGVAVGIVSERDLFALQRLSLNHVSTSIRDASDVDQLKLCAQNIRRFARSLLGQGVQSRQLSSLISHLNDVLTERLLEIKAKVHGVDMQQICWLALGSEGRSEQTIATDQDNALILSDHFSEAQREVVLAFARDVNAALDACGYPLCKGGIMAGQAGCCLTLEQWRQRFGKWIEHGAPQDLLNASIYFDFRPLAGNLTLAATLREAVNAAVKDVPRFFKQMAQNALTRRVPLNWVGGIAVDDKGRIDLKLQGSSIFVDAARLYALAHGISLTGTRERLLAVGPLLGVSGPEFEAWVSGFEFLQMLRLQTQLEVALPLEQANQIELARLNDIDRRILRETFRVARSLQQRMQLDYER